MHEILTVEEVFRSFVVFAKITYKIQGSENLVKIYVHIGSL